MSLHLRYWRWQNIWDVWTNVNTLSYWTHFETFGVTMWKYYNECNATHWQVEWPTLASARAMEPLQCDTPGWCKVVIPGRCTATPWQVSVPLSWCNAAPLLAQSSFGKNVKHFGKAQANFLACFVWLMVEPSSSSVGGGGRRWEAACLRTVWEGAAVITLLSTWLHLAFLFPILLLLGSFSWVQLERGGLLKHDV